MSPPGVCQHLSLFWSVTLQPLGAEQSAVYHVKENSNTFHMRYSSMICTKGLQKYDSSLTLNKSCLAQYEGDGQSPRGRKEYTIKILLLD